MNWQDIKTEIKARLYGVRHFFAIHHDRVAVMSGHWDDKATWENGKIPGSADTIYTNGFTITLDRDASIGEINARATLISRDGGGVIIETERSVYVRCGNIWAGRDTALALRTGPGSRVDVIGDMRGSKVGTALHYHA